MLRKVYIKNYKSIGECDVELSRFTVLVGPNGAGKSNFLNGLSFIADCLRDSVDFALRTRGGLQAVRRKSRGHPYNITIRLALTLEGDTDAEYSFTLNTKEGEFGITEETCRVSKLFGDTYEFSIKDGIFKKEIPGVRSKLERDRLALFAASATEEFRPVYDYLTRMRFYSIVPSEVSGLHKVEKGDFLNKDGGNAAAVLKNLKTGSNEPKWRLITSVLEKVVPGVKEVSYQLRGDQETLLFHQEVKGDKAPWEFDASSMSDGTLRVFGLLLALYQPGKTTFIGIEEPEATVHPAVVEVLMDVISAVSTERQIVITTHSPDILDYPGLTDDQIRIVQAEQGDTHINALDFKTREVARKRLYTFGELLKINELTPEKKAASSQLDIGGSEH